MKHFNEIGKETDVQSDNLNEAQQIENLQMQIQQMQEQIQQIQQIQQPKPLHHQERTIKTQIVYEKEIEYVGTIAFSAGVCGLLFLPIICVNIGVLASIISFYRLRNNENFSGQWFTILGAVLTAINIFWMIYFKNIDFFEIFEIFIYLKLLFIKIFTGIVEFFNV